MNLVERFKTERIAINCETEQEANKFIDWCYDNGLEFYNGKKTYFSEYLEITCYSYNYCGDCKLEYCRAEFYDERNWKIIKYKDYFKEGIKMKNFEKYIKEISKILANSHCDNAHLCNICNVRNVCEKLASLDEKEIQEFLLTDYKEPIKLTQFEYDIINYHGKLAKFNDICILMAMKNKGHFKDMNSAKKRSMTIKEILENCEVVENVD